MTFSKMVSQIVILVFFLLISIGIIGCPRPPGPKEDPILPTDPNEDPGILYSGPFPPEPGKQDRSRKMHPKECDPEIENASGSPSSRCRSPGGSPDTPGASQQSASDRIISMYPRPDCGLFSAKPAATSRVYRGYRVWKGQFPWAVSIRRLMEKGQGSGLYSSFEYSYGHCSGSLIEPTWVLTAAHCFSDLDFKDGDLFYLLFNEPFVRNATRVQNFIKKSSDPGQNVFYQKEYDAAKQRKKDPTVSHTIFDICLLRLYERAPGLPEDGRYDGDPETVNTVCYYSSVNFAYIHCEKVIGAGYGRLGKIPSVLNTGYLHWATGLLSRHIKFPDELFHVNPSKQTFASGDVRYPHLCSGDSGAPIHWYQLSGRESDEIKKDNETHQISKYRAIQIGIHDTTRLIKKGDRNPRGAPDYYLASSPKISNYVRNDFFANHITKIRENLPDPYGTEWRDVENHLPWHKLQLSCIDDEDGSDED